MSILADGVLWFCGIYDRGALYKLLAIERVFGREASMARVPCIGVSKLFERVFGTECTEYDLCRRACWAEREPK